MEKNAPTYDLGWIKKSFATVENLVMSSKVLRDLTKHGISLEELVQAIQALNPIDFIQSISLSPDEAIWQDMYSTHLTQFILKFQKTETGHLIIC